MKSLVRTLVTRPIEVGNNEPLYLYFAPPPSVQHVRFPLPAGLSCFPPQYCLPKRGSNDGQFSHFAPLYCLFPDRGKWEVL